MLKGQSIRAAQVQKKLAELPGVSSAEANPVTGSLIVHYDPQQTSHAPLLDNLRQWGYLSSTDQPVSCAPAFRLGPVAAVSLDRVAKVAGACLVEKAVEHSILLLLAAVL